MHLALFALSRAHYMELNRAQALRADLFTTVQLTETLVKAVRRLGSGNCSAGGAVVFCTDFYNSLYVLPTTV